MMKKPIGKNGITNGGERERERDGDSHTINVDS